jgi:opacity protein-like surface antigen
LRLEERVVFEPARPAAVFQTERGLAKETTVKVHRSFVGTAALGMLALPAWSYAQVDGANAGQEFSIYASRVSGGDLTDTEVSGRTPELDSDAAVGVRYRYGLTDSWGLEFSLGHNANSVTEVAGGDIDLDLTTFDIDAVLHFGGSARWSPYTVFGVGYAWTDLDRPIAGIVDGDSVTIGEDDGATLNVGVGAAYAASERVLLHLEARYRYYERLVDSFDDSVGTVEPTISVGWRF